MDCSDTSSRIGYATPEYSDKLLHNTNLVCKMSAFEVRKADPCEYVHLLLKKQIEEIGWIITEVSPNTYQLDIRNSFKRNHDTPSIARLDQSVRNEHLKPEDLCEIIASQLLVPLWWELNDKNYFLEIEGDILTLNLTWCSAPFVGKHIRLGSIVEGKLDECLAEFDLSGVPSKDIGLALYASTNDALYSNPSEKIYLITTGLLTCQALILSDPEYKSALLIHIIPETVSKMNINIELAIKFFTSLSGATKKIEARVIGGYTGQLGDAEGFHKTFLPTLTLHGIDIVETFIGNPDNRPTDILFDPHENKLYRIKLSKRDDKKLNEHYDSLSEKHTYLVGPFNLYRSNRPENLLQLHLTKPSK